MPKELKKSVRVTTKKRKRDTVVVISTEIDEKDTLFPEKVSTQKRYLARPKSSIPDSGQPVRPNDAAPYMARSIFPDRNTEDQKRCYPHTASQKFAPAFPARYAAGDTHRRAVHTIYFARPQRSYYPHWSRPGFASHRETLTASCF
jgi:hypothetical protein